jgi:hypothetical protein
MIRLPILNREILLLLCLLFHINKYIVSSKKSKPVSLDSLDLFSSLIANTRIGIAIEIARENRSEIERLYKLL